TSTLSAAPVPTASYTLSLHDALPICADTPHLRNLKNLSSCSLCAPGRLRLATTRSKPMSSRQERSLTIIGSMVALGKNTTTASRSEEHTSELQSRGHLVCRLLLEKIK